MKTKINRQQLLFEFISVVFAVLFALLLNNWRENIKSSKAAARVMESIKEEIMKNDNLLRSSLEYRTGLLEQLYNGTYVTDTLPVSQLPIDARDDQELENFLKEFLPFASDRTYDRIEVRSNGDQRILIMNDRIHSLVTKNDTLFVRGVGNIKLRSADITNRSWEIAQLTNAIIEMDLELINKLSELNTLNENYLHTSELAVSMVYRKELGIISVIEDMRNYEEDIINLQEEILGFLE